MFKFGENFLFTQSDICYLFLNDEEKLDPRSKNHIPKKTKIHLPLNKKAIFVTFHE